MKYFFQGIRLVTVMSIISLAMPRAALAQRANYEACMERYNSTGDMRLYQVCQNIPLNSPDLSSPQPPVTTEESPAPPETTYSDYLDRVNQYSECMSDYYSNPNATLQDPCSEYLK